LVEKLPRRVSVFLRAHDRADPDARGRRPGGAVVLLSRPRPSDFVHGKDDRDSKAPELPLVLELEQHEHGRVELGLGRPRPSSTTSTRRGELRRSGEKWKGERRVESGPPERPAGRPQLCAATASGFRDRGVAYLQTHPGTACAWLHGRIRIDTRERPRVRAVSSGVRDGRDPVYRSPVQMGGHSLSRPRPARPKLAGQATISYVDPADEEKRAERERIYLEERCDAHGGRSRRPASRPGATRSSASRAKLPRSARRALDSPIA